MCKKPAGRKNSFIYFLQRYTIMETVIISKQKYDSLVKKSEVDKELVSKIKASLEDIKKGNISEWHP